LSCDGSRLWGPLVQFGISYFISEPGGTSEDLIPGCRVLWIHEPERECSDPYTVKPEGLTQVALNGDLNFQTPDQTNYQMTTADITLSDLSRLPSCVEEESSTDSNTSGGETDNEGSTVTPLSCDGDRVWGPEDGENGEMIYISERDCAIFWIYDQAQNCAQARNIAEIASAGVAQDGTLEFWVNETLFVLNPADISFTELLRFPSCPSE